MMETILLYTTVQWVPCRQKAKRQGGRRFSEPSEAVVLLSVLISGVPAGIVKRTDLLTTSLRVL